jgi:photosystem II stability/assembly factor-like uncharacterized protein
METITCPHCSQGHPSGTRFCPRTGLAITPSVCPSCGKPIEAGWQVCAYCGQTLRTVYSDSVGRTTDQSDRPWALKPISLYGILALLLVVLTVFGVLIFRGLQGDGNSFEQPIVPSLPPFQPSESEIPGNALPTKPFQPSLTSEAGIPVNTPGSSQSIPTKEDSNFPQWYLMNRPSGLLSVGAKFSISPLNPQYRYVSLPGRANISDFGSSYGLLASSDGGHTWNNILTNLSDLDLSGRNENLQIIGVADPINEKAIFVVAGNRLYSTPDGGLNWELLLEWPEIMDFVPASDGKTLYVLSNSGSVVSYDRGQTWNVNTEIVEAASSSPFGITARSLAVDATEPTIAYAVVGEKMFVTQNAGVSWIIPDFLSAVPAVKVFTDQEISKLVYLVSLEQSLYKSSDGGISWRFVADLSNYNPSPNTTFSYVFEAVNGAVYHVKNDECNTSIIVSEDQGSTWRETGILPNLRVDFGSYLGNVCPAIYSITLEENSIWSLSGYGSYYTRWLTLMLSTNLGQDWELVEPLYRQDHIAASRDGSVIYVSGYHVYKTEDSGNTWQDVVNSLDWFSYYDIDVSSQNPEVAYVSASNRNEINILKTQDGGNSWNKIIDGDEDLWSCSYRYFGNLVAVNPENDRYIYLNNPGLLIIDGTSLNPLFPLAQSGCALTNLHRIAFAPQSSLNILLSPGNGLYWSSDGGMSIENRGLGNDFFIDAIAYDPNDSNLVYIMANINDQTSLFVSHDGGVSWDLVSVFNENEVSSTNLIVDPRNSMTLYLLSEGVIYRSLDRGISWEQLSSGISFSELLTEMILVHTNPPKLYAVGNSGVWRIELP